MAWTSDEAFVNSLAQRTSPAGSYLVVNELPRGMTCRCGQIKKPAAWEKYRIHLSEDKYPSENRPAYQIDSKWQGEKPFAPPREMEADKFRQWYHFDAEGKTLGILARHIAKTLRGKLSPYYDPCKDIGAFVVVTNCEKVRIAGRRYHYKIYMRNLSKRPGCMRVERFKDLLRRFPERVIMKAVWGNLPKTKSSRRIFKERLKLFAGPNHLYYDKNPVEYPMWKIRDMTYTAGLFSRWRLGEVLKKIPLSIKRKEAMKVREEEVKLGRYKRFLMAQLQEEGAEAAERMSLTDFALHAETTRLQKVFNETGHLAPKKGTVNYWVDTGLKRVKTLQFGGNKPPLQFR